MTVGLVLMNAVQHNWVNWCQNLENTKHWVTVFLQAGLKLQEKYFTGMQFQLPEK